MTLQNKMIAKINSFCTQQELKKQLEKCAKLANKEDRLIFINMANYFDLLFYKIVDVEQDAIIYKDAVQASIETVERHAISKSCEFLACVRELLQIKVDYVSNFRRLN